MTTTRAEERALAFHQCAQCTYDLLTGEGERGCHYYACPYLPEALDVQCPTCMYNFHTRDGQPECSDPPTCEFARTTARERVALARRWHDHETA